MPQLSVVDSIYWWYGDYYDRLLPKQAGFKWSPEEKQWWTKDHQKALILKKYADIETAARIDEEIAKLQAAVDASLALDADLHIPVPEGLEYRPYQKAGIAYALRTGNAFIADEMGLGKTIQAIGVLNATRWRRVLVICPASAKINWQRELVKWLVERATVEIASGKRFPDSEVVVINYDILKKHKEVIDATAWDYLIIDEAHYLKNPKTIRTKMVYGWGGEGEKVAPINASRKLALTGTPILNRPIEIWPTIHALAPQEFPSYFEFAKRYCGAYDSGYGWVFTGSSNAAEFQQKLRASIMIRRLKHDVLKELPAKRRQIILLDPDLVKKAVKSERSALTEYGLDLMDMDDAEKIPFDELAVVRHETALAKVPFVVNHLVEILESGEKAICFAHHRDVIEGIATAVQAKGFGVVTLTGSSTSGQRQYAVDHFQEDESVRLFVGNITAAGQAITLTAASIVVFAEIDWVPGKVLQAEDRAHRIGQEESVLIQHLVIDGSIDARLTKAIVEKQEMIERNVDGGGEEVVKEVDLSNTEQIILREKEKLAAKQAQRMDANLSPEEVTRIHNSLRFLASRCDGARALDGQGFNGFDAELGRQWANQRYLSIGQAVAAKKMLQKYRRQLSDAGY
jgi:SWI/SNF-related matrix-associated actin-dependent regulator 1 of chromatin subfamily A